MHRKKRSHILIFDPDITLLCLTADFLRRRGFDCSCTTDSTVAHEMFNSNPYDFIIYGITKSDYSLFYLDEIRAVHN